MRPSTETLEAETNDAFAKESAVGLALGLARNNSELGDLAEKLKSSPWPDLGTALEFVLNKTPAETASAMRDQDSSGEVRLFSAMRLSIDPAENSKTDDLYYAHCILG